MVFLRLSTEGQAGMHQLMGRRRALALATSLIVLTYLGRRCAWAQSSVEEVAKLLLHDREAAGDRVAMLRKAAYPLSEETARGLSDYDYRSRLREAQALASVVADEAAEKQLLVYDYIYLVDAMIEAKVSPLPDPAKISPALPPSSRSEARSPQRGQAVCRPGHHIRRPGIARF
jgi:hypothetical protein